MSEEVKQPKKKKRVVFTIDIFAMCFLLFLTFMVLKLCRVVDWSWWWVSAPLWVPFAASFLFTILGVMLVCLFGLLAMCGIMIVFLATLFVERKPKVSKDTEDDVFINTYASSQTKGVFKDESSK